MLELVVEGLSQIICDKSISAGKELTAVRGHFPAGDVCGKMIHYRQFKFWR
jgi:hypothetical protein